MRSVRSLVTRKQRGVLMVALMAGIAVAMILSTAAVQAWSDVARRDAEAEMIFRAQDITRALKRFQQDRGRLPLELKELLEVGAHRPQYFIRKLWKDPLVKGGQWQLIYASPGGGFFDPTAPGAEVPGAGGPGAGTGTGTGSPFGTGSLLQPQQTPQPGQPPAPGGEPGAFPQIGRNQDGSPNVTGLPIAGVKTRCTDRPFRRYKEKDQYSDWVFSIFDLEPRAPAMTAPQPGQPGQPAPQGQGQAPPSFPPK